jgi:hypothetical protein
MRRWMLSAAIVVFAHAAIVSAVLTWRKVIAPSTYQSPIEISLTPEPAAPVIPRPAPPRPVTPPATSATPPAQQPQPRETAPAPGNQATLAPGPSVRRPPVNAPIIVTPQDRAQQEHDALHGKENPAALPKDRIGGPIDTDLARPGTPLNQRGLNDWRRALLARPGTKSGLAPYLNQPKPSIALANPGLPANSGLPGTLGVLPKLGPSTSLGGRSLRHGPRLRLAAPPARNAIGAVEPNSAGRPGSDLLRNSIGALGPRGSTGIAAPTGVPGSQTTTNAIGIEVPRNTGGSNGLRHGPGARPLASPGATATSPRLGLNGTGMSRPGSGPGRIGGAPSGTGGLNGTSFRSR